MDIRPEVIEQHARGALESEILDSYVDLDRKMTAAMILAGLPVLRRARRWRIATWLLVLIFAMFALVDVLSLVDDGVNSWYLTKRGCVRAFNKVHSFSVLRAQRPKTRRVGEVNNPWRRIASRWQVMESARRHFVAQFSVADSICNSKRALCCAPLEQGFAFIPISADFIESVTAERPPQCTETFALLTDQFNSYLAELSRSGPLAYVEKEYFGGVGGQGVALYESGEITFAPYWSDYGAINSVLSRLGVTCDPGFDEFDTLGLGQHRDNDGWLEVATNCR